ncbi:MAG TPA: hypothetical protein VML55_20785 [Planctomycetaceae bacterium]|nr:hypothetical protein [Planctomycetaceae bacterium]
MLWLVRVLHNNGIDRERDAAGRRGDRGRRSTGRAAGRKMGACRRSKSAI